MEKITLQKIFNLAWQAFIVGDAKPAVNRATEKCCYLTTDGNKCAVGLALPDGHKAQTFSGSFNRLVELNPELFDDSVLDFQKTQGYQVSLNDFQQRLHDRLLDGDGNWMVYGDSRKNAYLATAKLYGLTVPE